MRRDLFASTIVPPWHEGRGKKRKHHLAALISAGVSRLHDAPLRARRRCAQRFDFARKADGVAGEHGPQPAQLAKSRRRPADCDLLAAFTRECGKTLTVCDQKLHAHRADMPAGGGQAAEQRIAAGFLVEMKRLRIKLDGEALDIFRREGEGADVAPLPHLEIFEEPHQPALLLASRRLMMIGETISHSASPALLRTVLLKVTIPVSVRLFDTRASMTSTSSIKSSPG